MGASPIHPKIRLLTEGQGKLPGNSADANAEAAKGLTDRRVGSSGTRPADTETPRWAAAAGGGRRERSICILLNPPGGTPLSDSAGPRCSDANRLSAN
jgi:hypothetical protein